jgi:hypothetical protein
MPNHWQVAFENGNSLSICSLPPKTFYLTQKDSVAFAYPGGGCPLPFTTAGVFILSAKNYPLPETALQCSDGNVFLIIIIIWDFMVRFKGSYG